MFLDGHNLSERVREERVNAKNGGGKGVKHGQTRQSIAKRLRSVPFNEVGRPPAVVVQPLRGGGPDDPLQTGTSAKCD